MKFEYKNATLSFIAIFEDCIWYDSGWYGVLRAIRGTRAVRLIQRHWFSLGVQGDSGDSGGAGLAERF